MSYFSVTASELRSKAGTLQELNGQLRTKETDLDNQEGSVCSMWEGQAKDLFHQAYISDREQMDNFNGLIENYVSALLEIAQRYEDAEARSAEIAATRAY